MTNGGGEAWSAQPPETIANAERVPLQRNHLS